MTRSDFIVPGFTTLVFCCWFSIAKAQDTTAPEMTSATETVVLYETTTPTRDGSGNIVYSQDNSSTYSNAALQADGARIGYRMEVTYNGTAYYAEVMFDAWENITLTDLMFPTTTNGVIQQRTVTNMSVASNYSTVTTTASTSGRLEIWKHNYGDNANNNIGAT